MNLQKGFINDFLRVHCTTHGAFLSFFELTGTKIGLY